MNDKKGFTLVELLSVIVILGLLMVLGINVTLKYLENSKRSTFQQEVRRSAEAAETMYGKSLINDSIKKKKTYLLAEVMPSLSGYKGCIVLDDSGHFKEAYVYNNEYLTNGANNVQLFGDLNNSDVLSQTNDNKFTAVRSNATDKFLIRRKCGIPDDASDDTSNIIVDNVMIKRDNDNYFWKYKSDIKRVIFSSTINKPNGTLKGEWDVSTKNNGSVMAYLTNDNILHIQANGKVYANSDSSFFFEDFSNLSKIDSSLL